MTMLIADTIDDALTALAEGARPIAGGSDLVVSARRGKAPLPDHLVAIDRIAELRGIEASSAGLRIGATTTHADLLADPRVPAGLADAAALVGSPSTRNVGTLGGNLMNGSPAMDTGAPLLTMDASVELRTAGSVRSLPLAELWDGPGSTTATADELCTAVTIPATALDAGTAYVRLEYRRAMEIAVVGAGSTVSIADDGSLGAAAVALTAVAPTIVALDGLDGLLGRPADDALFDEVAALARDQASPISDLRASDTYRRHCVGVMARRSFEAACVRARGTTIAVPVNRASGIGEA